MNGKYLAECLARDKYFISERYEAMGRGSEVTYVLRWVGVCLAQSQHLRSLACLPDGDATGDCTGAGGTAIPLS